MRAHVQPANLSTSAAKGCMSRTAQLLGHTVGAMLIATVIISFSTAPLLRAFDVACRTGTAGAIGSKGWVDWGNFRHLSISIPSSWEGTAHGNRVLAAIAAWNQKSGQTEVVLEPYFTSNGLGGDVAIQMMGGTGNPSCGNYNSADDRVSLHPDLLAAAGSLPDQVEYVIRHEVGHVLGLDSSSNSSSAMYAPSYPACSSLYIESFPTHGIHDDDAWSAGHCAHQLSQTVSGGGAEEWDFNGECWDYYLVTTWYIWDWETESWEAFDESWQYLYTDCSGPPLN